MVTPTRSRSAFQFIVSAVSTNKCIERFQRNDNIPLSRIPIRRSTTMSAPNPNPTHGDNLPPVNENEGAEIIGDGPENERDAAAVTVRLSWPRMNMANIELWFLRVDNWFIVNRITSDATRFSTIVAALDPELLSQVYVVVKNPPPPPASKYEALKNAVVRNFTESEQRRAQLYVTGLQLGDKKPSHLLNDLRRVGGDTQDEKLLKALWLNRLPTQVQTCLAVTSQPLAQLAELADTVMETFRVGTSSHVNVVSSDTNTSTAAVSSPGAATNNTAKSSDSDALAKLTAKIEKLARQMARLTEIPSRSRSVERSSARARSATPANNGPDEDGRCWYHHTYGSRAVKCRDPCIDMPTDQKN